MGQYVQNSLISGEKIEKEAVIIWFCQFWYFLIAIILLFMLDPILCAIAAVLVVCAVINALTTELAVTNKKVIGKVGVIHRESVDVPLSNLESIVIDQGVLGRIFNFGTDDVKGIGGNLVGIRYMNHRLNLGVLS
jgi:membrane protein YdbS with pleckstrin-like domain